MIVADTNLLAYLHIKGKNSPVARQVVLQDPHWAAPFLWRSEFRNTLITCVKGGLVERNEVFGIMAAAESMLAGWEYDVVSDEVLELATATGCTAYDAEFVALARDLRVPLVTTDKELLEKFPDTAVSPEHFLARP
ncbi:MAG: type II toxin-antitoxin system VapC family toxin [Candidatus Aminicenantes bacterium]|nr:type II toxin-antitoxin system VapC family toxin [Candidatus Aminicenantes bacterium]